MSSAYKFTPVKHKGTEGETTVVDRVALFTDKDQNMVIKFIIRHTRRPEVILPFFLNQSFGLLLTSIGCLHSFLLRHCAKNFPWGQ